MATLNRRQLLITSTVVAATTMLGAGVVPAVARSSVGIEALAIRARDSWARSAPRGALSPEPDVRFLLVHHTATSNSYGADDVPEVLESVRQFHTSPDKGWADVAYNFFVDRFGGIWEGRAGSLRGPVRGDATGGNQGFAQLCCFIGNHQREPPTPAATESMIALLAALADRHALDTHPGSTTAFTSRGSNRWTAGETATVRTIAGHRDVSRTECPGDRAYALLEEALPAAVTARRTTAPALSSTLSPTTSSGGAQAVEAEDDHPSTSTFAAAAVGATAVTLGIVALRRRDRGTSSQGSGDRVT